MVLRFVFYPLPQNLNGQNVDNQWVRVTLVLVLMPQGSVLGPRLFVLYIADLTDAIHQHNVQLHAYADDSQLYMHCQHDDITATTSHLSQCVVEIGHWMAANRLQMNPAKT